jgi:hypothetical protein
MLLTQPKIKPIPTHQQLNKSAFFVYGQTTDELTYDEQIDLWADLKQYKAKFKTNHIEFPTKKDLTAYLNTFKSYTVDRVGDKWRVINDLNGNHHIVIEETEGLFKCDCLRFINQGDCSHVQAINGYVGGESVEVEWEPDFSDFKSEKSMELDDWYDPTIEETEAWIDDPVFMTHFVDPVIQSAEVEAEEPEDEDIEFSEPINWEDEEWAQSIENEESPTEPLSFEDRILATCQELQPNQDQLRAIERLYHFFVEGHEPFHLFDGSAGTGKTTVLQILLNYLRSIGRSNPVVFVAPTNKACKVLQKMVSRWGLDIDVMTVHRLLGLKPKKRGQVLEFEPDDKQKPAIEFYDWVCVDEGSMLSESLWDNLKKGIKLGQKVLVAGDIFQAPPVGEEMSAPWLEVEDRTSLYEIMRYGGAIGDIASGFRESIPGAVVQLPTIAPSDDVFVAPNAFTFEYHALKAFKSQEFKQDADYCRIICYSNNRVNALNQKVRDALHPGAARFIKGDLLVAQESYAPNEQALFQNSDELVVQSASIGVMSDWKVWWLEVAIVGTLDIVTIPVLHEDDEKRYNSMLKTYSSEKTWYKFWELKEMFANVRYPYAITSHKCQGSTYTQAFVDVANFVDTYKWIIRDMDATEAKKKIKERNQLLYTAITRASKRLVVLT